MKSFRIISMKSIAFGLFLAGVAACQPTMAGSYLGSEPVTKDRLMDSLKLPSDEGSFSTEPGTTRGIRIAESADTERSVSLEIPFDDGSDALSKPARRQLRQVGDAMEELHDQKFFIVGYADKKANKKLAKRRADAVRKYLLENFDIEESKLSSLDDAPADGSGDDGKGVRILTRR